MTVATSRLDNLATFLAMIHPVPAEWAEAAKQERQAQREMQPLECRSIAEVMAAWGRAQRMRQCLEDVLLVMLAVCLSTEQEGDQLFLQVVGVPGTSKTTFCDAVLVSKMCYPLEHLTGFHSGSTDATGDDYSLIARVNRKTMVTPEGDVLMSSPRFAEIMSQQRRIFDGTSGASYKNRKTDMRYTGLRTPWIIAGTPTIMETDQSQLGDRFLRVCIDKAEVSEERAILRYVVRSAMASVRRTSNCQPDTQLSPEKSLAYRLTGGYVDYIRGTAGRLLAEVEPESDAVADAYMDLGEFTAYLRARPNPDSRKQDVEHQRELPSRLAHQYVRLGCCLAAVMQRPRVDDDVLRIVRKVAIDTSRGKVLKLVQLVHNEGRESGAYLGSLSRWVGTSDEKMLDHLNFLLAIGAVENFKGFGPGADAHTRWRLSERMAELWKVVHKI